MRAQRAHVAWSGLSRGCHHHVYDLAPTREELQAWRETVQEVVGFTAVDVVKLPKFQL